MARLWLTEHNGPGIERELMWVTAPHYNIEYPAVHWAWHNEDRSHFIYLKDSLVTHFSLKYLNT